MAVEGSSSQYCRRSLVETSALFPTLTNDDTPSCNRWAAARIASPRAPLCVAMAMWPEGGKADVNVALRRMAGSVFNSPKQFGPIMRMPFCRRVSTSRSWASFPSGPDSAKPEEITITDLMPLPAHSLMTGSTASRGTTITARSTASAIAVTDEKAVKPAMVVVLGFTG